MFEIEGQCIVLTKSARPLDIGPVQLKSSRTKWGVFIDQLPVGPNNIYGIVGDLDIKYCIVGTDILNNVIIISIHITLLK